jgi:transcriptional regulator with XRE-family HTH domain
MSEKDLELYYEIGEKLRVIRLERGMTLAEVSGKLNIASKTLQRYECGERKIKIEILQKLADIYGFHYYDFIKSVRLDSIKKDYNIDLIYMDNNVPILAETSVYPKDKEFSFEDLRELVAYNAKALSSEQKIELIKLLSQ